MMRPRKTTTHRRMRLVVYRLISVTVIPLLFFLILEMILRLSGFGYPTSFVLPARQDNRPIFIDNPKFGWRFFPPPLARWAYPFAVSRVKAENEYRIVIVGGSAAQGDPNPSFSFGRILDAMLQRMYPDFQFSVINAAMTAINSHVIREIVEDCSVLKPDIYIIYLGNNEVVGPFGPTGVLHPYISSIPVIRAKILLGQTRIYQFLEHLLGAAGWKRQAPLQWQGMAMFADHHVPHDDPRLKRVYKSFETNLEKIVRSAWEQGARVVVMTVPVNLRDCPPFGSQHAAPFSQDEWSRWGAEYGHALFAQAQGDYREAIDGFLKALPIDGDFAELHYRIAQCYHALDDSTSASQHFSISRDLDVLRFRADSSINEAIRRVAGSSSWNSGISPQVVLFDACQVFDSWSHRGIPGNDLFVDHIHPSFKGNYVLARSLLPIIVSFIPALDTGSEVSLEDPPSLLRCAVDLAFTGLNEYLMAHEMYARFSRMPFANQAGHEERMKRLEQDIAQLEGFTHPEALPNIRQIYEQAILGSRQPWPLHLNYAEILAAFDLYKEAGDQLKQVLSMVPHHRYAQYELARVLTRQERFAQTPR